MNQFLYRETCLLWIFICSRVNPWTIHQEGEKNSVWIPGIGKAKVLDAEIGGSDRGALGVALL
jgi:hypothetical protein